MNIDSLPRMRTISETCKEFKKVDPDSALTESALRAMIKNGDITCVTYVGTRALINFDALVEMLTKNNKE